MYNDRLQRAVTHLNNTKSEALRSLCCHWNKRMEELYVAEGGRLKY